MHARSFAMLSKKTPAPLPRPGFDWDASVVETFGLPMWLDALSNVEALFFCLFFAFLCGIYYYGIKTPMKKVGAAAAAAAAAAAHSRLAPAPAFSAQSRAHFPALLPPLADRRPQHARA